MNAPDAFQQILDETRQRFVATFDAQCDSIRILADKVAALGPRGPVAALTQATHRLSGLAGTIGFPMISARASELEELVSGAGRGAFDALLAGDAVDAIREAFTTDLASPPVWSTPPAVSTARRGKILVAEDASDQRTIVTTSREGAGDVPMIRVLIVDDHAIVRLSEIRRMPKGPETCGGSEPCERRDTSDRRETASGRPSPVQVMDLRLLCPCPGARGFPRRRAVRGAACFWPIPDDRISERH